MRLLVALACVAVASAASEPKPIELPSPALPTVQTEKQTPVIADVTLANLVKYVNSLLAVAMEEATSDAISIKNPKLPEETSPERTKVAAIAALADEMLPVNVADASADPLTVIDGPERIKVAAIATMADEILPVKVADSADPMRVIDGPIDMGQTFQYPIATPEQIAELFNTDRVQELPLNDPEAMRKLFPNPMSLIDISPTFVSDDVMRQVAIEMNSINVGGAHPFSFNNAEPLDSVEPVMVADNPVDELDSKMDPVMVVESAGEQGSFAEMPETVKVVESAQIQPLEIPLEYFRGPEKGRIPVPQESWKAPQVPKETWTIPREMWRGPPPMQDNEPVYFRDEYNMPLPAYNDPALR